MLTGIQLGVIALNLVMGAVLLRVGLVVLRRRPRSDAALAGMAFALWWFALAFLQLAGAISTVIHATAGWSLPAFLAYMQALLLLIVVALGCLMYYMVYLYTGRRSAWKPLAVLYGLFFLAILYFLALSEPMGLEDGRLGPDIDYGNDLRDSTFATVLGVLLVAPPLLGALAYFSLFFRVQERSQKFRIAAISGAFILWFGSNLLVGQLTDWNETLAWRIGSAMITLGAALAVYAAFQPPTWMRQRFRLAGYGEA